MQPYPSKLIKTINLKIPLIGFYDVPDKSGIETIVQPTQGSRRCVFSFYDNWLKGEYLLLTKENYGCGGAANAIFNHQTRTLEEFIRFLVEDEGLKANKELMKQWHEKRRKYQAMNKNILIGPLNPNLYDFLRTITFFVNPDQLGMLSMAAQYFSAPDDPDPVVARFGAGCMQLISVFDDLKIAQAQIGATDIAMRQHLPADVLAFTTTKPMYEHFCLIDEKSFISKSFWKRLKNSRKNK